MIIAIDGPAGSGKSSTARAVAARLGITYLDTGAMYRAITLRCLREGIEVDDNKALAAAVASADIRFEEKDGVSRIFLRGEDVTEAIRSEAVTGRVSEYCAPAVVREKLVEQQREIAQGRSIVCEGRDIGTVVFPAAELKFFMTATPEERAKRRQLDFKALGVVKTTAELAAEIAERDRKDSTRDLSPLRQAPDAESLDTTGMTLDEQVDYIVNKAVPYLQGRRGTETKQPQPLQAGAVEGMTNSPSEENKIGKGVDSSGQEVDLSDFEEAYYTPDQVESALSEYNKSLDGLEEGQVVRGKILRITNKEVIVDVNFKSEGIIPLFEFKNVKDFKPGDEIDVYLEQVEDSEGQIILSKSRADFLKVWDRIFDSYEKQETIEGRVLRRIKGGVVVDLFGIDAFLPGSQIDLRQIPDMDTILGQTYKFRVIKVNKVRRNIVVSRRVILEEDRSALRGKILAELEKGQIREGTVKNITDFGAFIDLGGVDGLLHITDMSWGRVNHPSEIVALGDRLKVKVLDFNENKERISLGIKQLSEHPWKGIEEKYPEGARVRGKIVSITDYGAFLELEKGIEGLIHISEMSWTQHIKHPSKIVGVGDIIEAMVLKIDKANQKISLGIKQLEPDPWEKVPGEFHPGDIVTGKIRNLAAFGAFVELKEGVDGLIHISDMSWTKKINHPGELVKKGDSVEVKVLDVDVEKRRISLGVKQLSDDPWPNLVALYALGTEITECEVVRILDRGVVVNLTNDVEGFVPLNQLGIEVNHPSRLYKVGDKIPGEVVEFDLDSHKIVISVTDYFKDKDPSLLAEFTANFPLKPMAEVAKPVGKPPRKKSDDAQGDASDEAAPEAEAPEAAAEEKAE